MRLIILTKENFKPFVQIFTNVFLSKSKLVSFPKSNSNALCHQRDHFSEKKFLSGDNLPPKRQEIIKLGSRVVLIQSPGLVYDLAGGRVDKCPPLRGGCKRNQISLYFGERESGNCCFCPS